MKLFFVIIIFCILIGCTLDNDCAVNSAPTEYTWTPEQWEEIKKETDWAAQHTDWKRNQCYGAAIIRHGTKIKKEGGK